MREVIFLDSSAIYAFINKKDPNGCKIEEYLKSHPFVLETSNLVFSETISLVTKRLGKSTGVKTGQMIADSQFIKINYVDKKIHDQAWQMYRKYKDKDFDLIDATSFVLCQKKKIQKVLTLDNHFLQMGYQTIP